MSKNLNTPVIVTNLHSLSIKSLRQLHFFNSDGFKSEFIDFKSSNLATGLTFHLGTFKISVSVQEENCYVEFDYIVDGDHYMYQVSLSKVFTAKGGFNWYFICPTTGDKCRKLYFYQEQFVSRKTIPNAIYKGQWKSKKERANYPKYNKLNRLNDIILEGRLPSFKRMYRGKLTKRFIALMEAVREKQAMNDKAFYDWMQEQG